MSRTLNLVDCLLARGRNLEEVGRSRDALQVLGRLIAFRQLPAAVAEETQARLAEIQLRHHEYTSARRHLAAALTQQPQNARYHYLLATALDQDVDADPERAGKHYRQSLALEPDQPDCLSDFGLWALCQGLADEGLEALRRAVELAPDDPEVVGKLAEGLSELERPEEARRMLRAALFRNPRDLRFQKLWSDFQFQQLGEAQMAAQARAPAGSEAAEGPVLLPFVAPKATPPRKPPCGRLFRHDGPPSPHAPHLERWSGKKHA